MLSARRVVTVTAAEAAKHGLPAVGISVDLGGTVLMERHRTEGRCFLRAGGPPGGTLGFEVWVSEELATDHAAVQRAAAAHYQVPDLGWGLPGPVVIAGADRPALTFLSSLTPYDPIHGCAVLVPHRQGAVLVAVSRSHLGAAPVSCDRVVADLARALATFAILES